MHQFSDYFNTRFSIEDVFQHIEDIALSIEAEQSNQMLCWQDFIIIDNWRGEVDYIKEFTQTRIGHLNAYIQECFALTGKSLLTVNK